MLRSVIVKGVFKSTQDRSASSEFASALYYQSIDIRVRRRERQLIKFTFLCVILLEAELSRLIIHRSDVTVPRLVNEPMDERMDESMDTNEMMISESTEEPIIITLTNSSPTNSPVSPNITSTSIDHPNNKSETHPTVVDLPKGVSCKILRFITDDIPQSQQRWKAMGKSHNPSLDLLSQIVEVLMECLSVYSRMIKKLSSSNSDSSVATSFVMAHRVVKCVTSSLHSAVMTISKHCKPLLPWQKHSTVGENKELIDVRIFCQFVSLLSGIPDNLKGEFSTALSTIGSALYIIDVSDIAQTPLINSVTSGSTPDFRTCSSGSLVNSPSVDRPVSVLASVQMCEGQRAVVALRVEYSNENSAVVRVVELHPSITRSMNISGMKALLKGEREGGRKRGMRDSIGSARKKHRNINEEQT